MAQIVTVVDPVPHAVAGHDESVGRLHFEMLLDEQEVNAELHLVAGLHPKR